jgi:hypothetical protein
VRDAASQEEPDDIWEVDSNSLRVQAEDFRKSGEPVDDCVRCDAFGGELGVCTEVAEGDKGSYFHSSTRLFPFVDDMDVVADHGGATAFLLGQDSWGADACPCGHY